MADQDKGRAALRPASSFSRVEDSKRFWRTYERAETQGELLGLLYDYHPYCSGNEINGIIDCYLFYADHRMQQHKPGEREKSSLYDLCEQAYLCLCNRVVSSAAADIRSMVPFFNDGGWRQALHEKLLDFFSVSRNFSSEEPCKRNVAEYLKRLYDMLTGRIRFEQSKWEYPTDETLANLRSKTVEALVRGGWVNPNLWRFLVERETTEALPLLIENLNESLWWKGVTVDPAVQRAVPMDAIQRGGIKRDLALTIIDLQAISKNVGKRPHDPGARNQVHSAPARGIIHGGMS